MPTSVLLLYWLTNVSTDCRFISFFMHGRSTEPFSLPDERSTLLWVQQTRQSTETTVYCPSRIKTSSTKWYHSLDFSPCNDNRNQNPTEYSNKKWQIDKNSNEIMPLYQTPLWSLSLSVSSSVFYGSRSLVRHCGRASGRQRGPRGQQR